MWLKSTKSTEESMVLTSMTIAQLPPVNFNGKLNSDCDYGLKLLFQSRKIITGLAGLKKKTDTHVLGGGQRFWQTTV